MCPRVGYPGGSLASPSRLPAGGGAMAADQETEVSEAQIAVHWPEEAYYEPPATFIAQANAADPALFERFSEPPFPERFKESAERRAWAPYRHTTLATTQ